MLITSAFLYRQASRMGPLNRSGSRVSSMIRHLSTLQESDQKRGIANGKSLDINLIATEPDLVFEHLKARRASDDVLGQIKRIGELRVQRSVEIQKGDKAKSERKTLSQQIGKLMKEG